MKTFLLRSVQVVHSRNSSFRRSARHRQRVAAGGDDLLSGNDLSSAAAVGFPKRISMGCVPTIERASLIAL